MIGTVDSNPNKDSMEINQEMMKDNQIKEEYKIVKDGPFNICNLMVPTIACKPFVTPILALCYLLPVMVYVLVTDPHDCF